jgi:outer membrane protein TolC
MKSSIKLLTAVYFSLVFCLSTSINMTAQSSITLTELLSHVEESAYPIKEAQNNFSIADSRMNLYKANLKPSFGLDLLLPNFLNTSTQVTQPDGSIAFQQITQNNSSISVFGNQNIVATGGQLFAQTDLQRFDNFTSDTKQFNGVPIRIGFVQPIFGYNRFKWDKQIFPLLREEASQAYKITIESAKWTATNLYFDVVLAQANQQIALTNKKVNEKLVEITQERLDLGKTSRDEFLQLEMGLKSAVLSENQAKNQVDRALKIMYTYIGKKDIPTLVTCEIPIQEDKKILDIEGLVRQANKNRPELKRYARELLQNEQTIAQTKAQYGIKAELFASFGFARGSEDLDQIYRNPFDEQQVRLNVSMPIVDWGKKKEAIKIATLQKENTQQRVAQESLELDNNIRTIASQFLQAQSDITLLNEIKLVAEERFQISNERYTLGNISITDLTLAQREKDQTLRNYLQALRNYWSSYFELRMLTGSEI